MVCTAISSDFMALYKCCYSYVGAETYMGPFFGDPTKPNQPYFRPDSTHPPSPIASKILIRPIRNKAEVELSKNSINILHVVKGLVQCSHRSCKSMESPGI